MELPRPNRQRKCISKLRAGEYKRIPASRGDPLVFYVSCPVCRYISAVDPARTKVDEEVGIVETPTDFFEMDVIASMEPYHCNRCRRQIAIADGAFHVDA